MDKLIIEKRFTKAVATYDENASAQRYIAQKMIKLMEEYIARQNYNNIFEFGCGTGLFSRLLIENFNPEKLFLNDLCRDIKHSISDILSEHSFFIPGDAEKVELPDKMDIITSVSTIQWFEEPFQFLIRMKRYLVESGYIAFSTFGNKNLQEIRSITGTGLRYYETDEIIDALSDDFQMIYSEEETFNLNFDKPIDVLYHLKYTGVNGTAGKRRFGKSDLKFFETAYSKFMDNGKYRLTYHPIYIILKKK